MDASRERAIYAMASVLWAYHFGRSESEFEREPERRMWLSDAEARMTAIGLVAVDPALVDAVRASRMLIVDSHNKCARCASVLTIFFEYLDGPCRTGCAACERVAAIALSDAILEQLGGGR